MGNTVSAAEVAATQIIHPLKHDQTEHNLPKTHPKIDYKAFSPNDIPAECPMHKEQTQQKSECPVQHDKINPLNMVITYKFYPNIEYLVLFIYRCLLQINNQLQINLSRYQQRDRYQVFRK